MATTNNPHVSGFCLTTGYNYASQISRIKNPALHSFVGQSPEMNLGDHEKFRCGGSSRSETRSILHPFVESETTNQLIESETINRLIESETTNHLIESETTSHLNESETTNHLRESQSSLIRQKSPLLHTTSKNKH